MGMLIGLLVPGLVWATVIMGLILVVREKVEEDDIVVFSAEPRDKTSQQSCEPQGCDQGTCCIYTQRR